MLCLWSILLVLRWSCNLLTIMRSSNLQQTHVIDIGLLEQSVAVPFLWTGVIIIAFFQTSGTYETESNCLKTTVRGTTSVDQKDLCVFCRTYTSVESLTTKTAGPIKRPSPSTIASLHDIAGLVAFCCKSHRLQLICDHYTMSFYYTTSMCRFKVLPLLSRNSLLAVVPWRHHLVMILRLNS